MNDKAIPLHEKMELGIDFVEWMIKCHSNVKFNVPQDSIRDLQTLKKILETGSAE